MTDPHWTSVFKVARLVAAALAGTLVVVTTADTAPAETLGHLRTQLVKPKVRAGSLPGHPDKDIRRPTVKIHGYMGNRKPPPPTGVLHHDASDGSDRRPRSGTHQFSAPVCKGDTCVSE
jgi:hypothetical protein